MLGTITKKIFMQTFSGDWVVLFNMSESCKEGKVEALPCSCHTGITVAEKAEESGILLVPECVC